jgi:hypothetical protein
MTRRHVALLIAAVGAAAAVFAVLADPLGVGGAPTFGWKQQLALALALIAFAAGACLWWTTASVRTLGLRALPLLLSFAVYLVAWLLMDLETTGDEPHYLLATGSLVYDGDVDLTNDYASAERTAAVEPAFPIDSPHAFRYEESDALIPLHGIGFSALLAPGFAVGGLVGARVEMIVLAALLADQLFRFLRQLGIARRRYAALAWAAVVFCLPLLAFSNQFYPEIPGALLTVIALRVVFARAPSDQALLVGGVATALIPWLHVRYLPISLALVVALAYVTRRRFVDNGRRSSTRVWRTVGSRIIVPYVVGVAALAGTFELWYGSPRPDAPYDPTFPQDIGGGGWLFAYHYFLGDVLSPGYGWIPYAPVHWVGLAGLACLIWRFRREALIGSLAVLAYVLVIASIGLPVGYSFPGRLYVTVVPLVAIPLAFVIDRVSAARVLFYPLFGASLAIAVVAVLNPGDLYIHPVESTSAHIPGVRDIQEIFPNVAPSVETAVPDWPVALLWVIATVAAGGLFVWQMRLRAGAASSSRMRMPARRTVARQR